MHFVLCLDFLSTFFLSGFTINFRRYFSVSASAIRSTVFNSISMILIDGNCTAVTFDFLFTLRANISLSCPVILLTTVLNYSLSAQTLKPFIESTNPITVTLMHCHT
jgi:hypothetical protein